VDTLERGEQWLRAAVRRPDRRVAAALRRGRPWIVVLLVLVALAATARMTGLRPPLVSVAAVKRGDVAAEVEGTGTVTADVLAHISSKITGRVEAVFADEGDVVQKGHVLAALDQTDLRRQVEKARAQLATANETARELQNESNRRQTLLAHNELSTTVEQAQQYARNYAVAQRAVEAVEADLGSAEYNLSLTQIPALTSGIVTKRLVNLGDSVVPGEPMFTVADTSLIYVSANIDQNLARKVTKWQKASVFLRGRDDHPLVGHVLRIDPQADAATEETVAEVTFKIPPDQFQLGQ
jgi:RND family efflux transporter MFP subunit